MGRRSKNATRCATCRMHVQRCVCPLMPSIPTRGRWVIVQHPGEAHKTTNTGHLAARALLGAHRCTVRSRTAPLDPPPDLGPRAWVLFPSDEAVSPEELPPDATIVVPDGTWTQARKMIRTSAQLSGLPRVGLPTGAHARWSLREETSARGMSTLDAVCWLLAALEGPAAAAPLEELARAMWARTMESRGTPVDVGADG